MKDVARPSTDENPEQRTERLTCIELISFSLSRPKGERSFRKKRIPIYGTEETRRTRDRIFVDYRFVHGRHGLFPPLAKAIHSVPTCNCIKLVDTLTLECYVTSV